jgi:drug/metabolite transporter (DMT)-like permease
MTQTSAPVAVEVPRSLASSYARLSIMVLIWAANWPLVKSIFSVISPVGYMATRLGGAVIIMGALAFPLREPLLAAPKERVKLALIGIGQIGATLGLSSVALQYVGPGRAAVLTHTMQLWALPLGWLIARDRVGDKAVAGGLIGFLGILVFLNPMLVNWRDPRILVGNTLLLASAISWALAASFYRRYRWQTPFWTQAFWQVLWSAVVTLLLWALVGEPRPILWTGSLLGVLAFNWFGCTALCYWWWGKVLSVMPASRAGQITSLVPATTAVMSALTGREPITLGVAASIVLISSGIFLTLRSK